MAKLPLLPILIGTLVIGATLGGVYLIVQNRPTAKKDTNTAVSINSSVSTNSNQILGGCEEKQVVIEGNTDKGKQLRNCFVEYPGEASRTDKSYYIVEDVCGQFTKEFMENLSSLKFTRIKSATETNLNNCRYYISEEPKGIGNYLFLVLEYLNYENQKVGQQALDRTISIDPRISMEHFIALDEKGQINEIYLKLGENKFIGINRSSTKTMTNEEEIEIASKIAGEIKGYK